MNIISYTAHKNVSWESFYNLQKNIFKYDAKTVMNRMVFYGNIMLDLIQTMDIILYIDYIVTTINVIYYMNMYQVQE